MPRRFYVAALPAGDRLVLEGSEAHHLLHVLRIAPGEQVTLFDGQGTDAVAELVGANAGSADLLILSRTPSVSELPLPLVLATAVPKGERFAWLVEKATELGVSKLIPLITTRSIVDPGAGKLAKMRQTVVAASKQCGRSRLMEIAEPVDWNVFLKHLPADSTCLLADPTGDVWPPSIAKPDREIALCIGPEGGFTTDERQQAINRGALLVGLGPRLLRIETAGIALSALAGSWISSASDNALRATV